MPIIRANPALPLPLTKGIPQIWMSAYDPANTGAQQANNTSVNPWQSKGAILPLNQATGINQPTYLTNIINGKPAISFDGNDSMQTNAVGLAVTTAFTFYCVFKLASAASTAQTLFSRGTSSATPNYVLQVNRTSANGGVSFFDGTQWQDSSVGITTTTDFNIVAWTWDGVNATTYINNNTPSVPSGLKTSPASTAGNFVVGGQGASGTLNFLTGSFLEILGYSTAHTASDVGDVIRFFANFYGLNF